MRGAEKDDTEGDEEEGDLFPGCFAAAILHGVSLRFEISILHFSFPTFLWSPRVVFAE